MLESTAMAIANMTAVAQQYIAAHRAFVIVPLVLHRHRECAGDLGASGLNVPLLERKSPNRTQEPNSGSCIALSILAMMFENRV